MMKKMTFNSLFVGQYFETLHLNKYKTDYPISFNSLFVGQYFETTGLAIYRIFQVVGLSIPFLWDSILKHRRQPSVVVNSSPFNSLFVGQYFETFYPITTFHQNRLTFNSLFVGQYFETRFSNTKSRKRHILSIPFLWDSILKHSRISLRELFLHSTFNSLFVGQYFETMADKKELKP